MNRRRVVLLPLFALAGALARCAESAVPLVLMDPLTVDSALRHAWRVHPDIARARLAAQAAGESGSVAALWPNPEMGVEAVDERGERRTAGIEVSQRIELGGDRRARRLAASAAAGAAQAELVETWCARRAAVKSGLALLDYANRRAALADRLRTLAGESAQIEEGLVAAGKQPEQARLDAQARSALARMRSEQAASLRRGAAQRLAAALALDPDTAETLAGLRATNDPIRVACEAETLVAIGRTNSPALAMARFRAAAAEARRAAVAAARWPDLTAGAGVMRIRPEEEDDRLGVGVQARFELPLRNLQRADVREADSQLGAARAGASATAADTAAALAEWLAEHAADRARCEALRSGVVPARARQAELARGRFEAGKASRLEWLAAEADAAEAALELADAEWNLASSAIQMERLAGVGSWPPL
jgi:outer membrane protein TolC